MRSNGAAVGSASSSAASAAKKKTGIAHLANRQRELSREYDDPDTLVAVATGQLKPSEADDYASEPDDIEEVDETCPLQSCLADDRRDRRRRSCWSSMREWLLQLPQQDYFKLGIGLVIVSNTVCMAIEIDHQRMGIWTWLNYVFLSIFMCEIILRMWAEGIRGYFCGKPDQSHLLADGSPDFDTSKHERDYLWNIFDFVVVGFGVIDEIIGLMANVLPQLQDASDDLEGPPPTTTTLIPLYHLHATPQPHHRETLWVVTAMRTLRILRVLRIVRVLRVFPRLRILVRGMLESMEVVFWIFLMMCMLVFACAILCTTMIGHNIDSFPVEDQADIEMYFGSVFGSMFTLFQILTMDGWGGLYYQVTKTQPFMILFFFPFVFIGGFVIMSLLTGVMADHMNDVRQTQEEEMRQAHLYDMKTAVEVIKKVNSDDNDETLSREEFLELFREKNFHKTLKDCGIQIGPKEAPELFECIDADRSGEVDAAELSHSLKHLQSHISSVVLWKLGAGVRTADQFVTKGLKMNPPPWQSDKDFMKRNKHTINALDHKLSNLEASAAILDDQFKKFVEYFDFQPEERSDEDLLESSLE